MASQLKKTEAINFNGVVKQDGTAKIMLQNVAADGVTKTSGQFVIDLNKDTTDAEIKDKTNSLFVPIPSVSGEIPSVSSAVSSTALTVTTPAASGETPVVTEVSEPNVAPVSDVTAEDVVGCPSHGKEPQKLETLKKTVRQGLIFHPDKNGGCLEESTVKQKRLYEIIAEQKAEEEGRPEVETGPVGALPGNPKTNPLINSSELDKDDAMSSGTQGSTALTVSNSSSGQTPASSTEINMTGTPVLAPGINLSGPVAEKPELPPPTPQAPFETPSGTLIAEHRLSSGSQATDGTKNILRLENDKAVAAAEAAQAPAAAAAPAAKPAATTDDIEVGTTRMNKPTIFPSKESNFGGTRRRKRRKQKTKRNAKKRQTNKLLKMFGFGKKRRTSRK